MLLYKSILHSKNLVYHIHMFCGVNQVSCIMYKMRLKKTQDMSIQICVTIAAYIKWHTNFSNHIHTWLLQCIMNIYWLV